MVYAEKRGLGYRVRWRDTDGKLQSAGGFYDEEEALAFGDAREGRPSRPRPYAFAHDELVQALKSETVRGTHGGTPEDLANAIIKALNDMA